MGFDSLGASGGALLFIADGPPSYVTSLEDLNIVSGVSEPLENVATGNLAGSSAVVSVPLTAGPEILAVYSQSNGQLVFTTRTDGIWIAPAEIANAFSAGGLSLALAPLEGGGAFLTFQGTDAKLYYSVYSGGSWSNPALLIQPCSSDCEGAYPLALSFDAQGDLFVTGWNTGVEEWPWTGSAPFTATSYGPLIAVSAQLSNPAGMFGDTHGNLYVADTGNRRIVELQPASSVNFGSQAIGSASAAQTLNFTISSGTTAGSIGVLTTGIASKDFADAGSSTCTATTYSSVIRCTVNVKFQPLAAGLRRGAVVFYSGANNTGTVLATVPVYGVGTGPQVAFGPGGAQTNVGSGFSGPKGVAVDGAGNVFIADATAALVDKVTPGGTQTTVGSGFSKP